MVVTDSSDSDFAWHS